jgi:hypothetical protein
MGCGMSHPMNRRGMGVPMMPMRPVGVMPMGGMGRRRGFGGGFGGPGMMGGGMGRPMGRPMGMGGRRRW